MKSISSAPGKVILFGEHFVVFGGKAILCAIDKKITVRSELTKIQKIQIESDLGSIGVAKNTPLRKIKPAFRPVVYVAQKILKKFDSKFGLKIFIIAEFPAGVGLGSSSACCVAAAGSISGLFAKYSKEEILNLATEAERTIFPNTSGADTNICVYGGVMEYKRDGTVRKINLKSKIQFLVIDSKITHSTSRVVLKVKRFKDHNPRVFSTLCSKEAEIIKASLRLLRDGNLNKVGQKMLENQTYLEKIGISNQTLNSIIESIKNTTYGTKITGAGDGGCVIALVDKSNKNAATHVLRSHGYDYFLTQINTIGIQQRVVKSLDTF